MILKREVMAAEARKLIEFHGDEWDQPHAIITLHPDGNGGLRAGAFAAVTLDVSPRMLPDLIASVAAEQLAEHPEDPAYALGFLMEGFGMTEPAKDATEEERERFQRARITRTFHEQPGAVESATAWVADIHGRTWCCQRRRDSGEIRETFHAPGGTLRGAVMDALVQAAMATGIAAWGMPPHAGGLN